MNTKTKALSATQLLVQDITVELIRKNVKNINLRVIHPLGRVRVSAPKRMPIDLIYAFVVSKYDWILLHQEKLQARTCQNAVKYDSGEIHHFFGQQVELQLNNSSAKPRVVLNEHILELHIQVKSTYAQRQKLVDDWYRCKLKQQIPALIKKYEHMMDLSVHEFRVKKMKTRWGTCNSTAKRIWLNLELAKKPIDCLDYVVLHEMTHFLEPKHNSRFYRLIAEYMPDWKAAEQKLSLS